MNLNDLMSQSPNEAFKAQFIQYLDVLKEKVAEMELKIKESNTEKNFYK